jgi:hypothetical protein
MKALAAFVVAASMFLGVGGAAAQSQPPTMTIKIYNDDATKFLFPVYTTGQHRAPNADIWLQAIFKNTKKQIQTNQFTYYSDESYRFYLTNANRSTPLAIPPGGSVSITVPLYTQLVATPRPSARNQYANWWNGATIQLFHSQTATPPAALVDDFSKRGSQKPLASGASGAVLPTCQGCAGLRFFRDTGDLPKSDPSQLLEFTLGARVEQCPIDLCKDDESPNTLDLANVDFDVSYVNVAYGPAAMGPYRNDQVGYVGSPMSPDDFSSAIGKFLNANRGWPQFVDVGKRKILKIASPLEIFTRLSGGAPPPDLSPLPNPKAWPRPESLWTPIRDLYANWTTWAGPVGQAGKCARGNGKQFCDAIIGAKEILTKNYQKYVTLFGPGKPCGPGAPAKLTDALMVAHVYGWTPFTEGGCPANANLLEDTPGYSENFYARYAALKELYDLLNYGRLPAPKYDFNPWVAFVHGARFAKIENAYAYSVDDAVGNIQAEGGGIIIDFADVKHLENQLPAKPPINISYGLTQGAVSFTRYATCKPENWKPVRPYFLSFIINANNPQNCPVYFEDDKPRPQRYTFTVVADPETFPLRPNPATQIWDRDTAKPIACKGNTDAPPYAASSRQFCCDLSSSAGVKAFSVPEAHSAHSSKTYYVITTPPKESRNLVPANDQTCSRGVKWP